MVAMPAHPTGPLDSKGAKEMTRSLHNSLQLKTQLELLKEHAIDTTIVADWLIKTGPTEEYKDGLRKWIETNEKIQDCKEAIHDPLHDYKILIRIIEKAQVCWALYSVQLNQKGLPKAGEAFLGVRIHPSMRKDGEMKFDCRGRDLNNRGIMLPAFSAHGAVELLGGYGYSLPAEYDPWHAWLFILNNPCVPIWVEESALKALSACSTGQIAIGLNGINSYCVPKRKDRLLPIINLLAKGGRTITVRFDCAASEHSKSEIEAQNLSRRLARKDANSAWWCWPIKGAGKTDDFNAGLLAGKIPSERRAWLYHRVTNITYREKYSRINKQWDGQRTDREFTPEEIYEAARSNRIIAIKGATGTNKSNSMAGAVRLLDEYLGKKLIVLGGYHRASLVHKGAREFGVSNMSAPLGSAERMGYHEGITLHNGLFCCGESAYKEGGQDKTLWDWYWELKENPRQAVLILDEISQVLPNWTMGGTETLSKKRSKTLDALEGLVALDCVRVWAERNETSVDCSFQWYRSIRPSTLHICTTIRVCQTARKSSSKTRNVSIKAIETEVARVIAS